jgi:hypothetical protein
MERVLEPSVSVRLPRGKEVRKGNIGVSRLTTLLRMKRRHWVKCLGLLIAKQFGLRIAWNEVRREK